MANIPRCRQNKFDCFANVKGRCFCLSDTRFEEKRECPFYKNRNTMPDFFEYFLKFLSKELDAQ